MSPREIAQKYNYKGITFDVGERIFFMFSSANRDESVFKDPDKFNLDRDVSPSVTFGAGPHYCAGAWVSRALIAEVALPKLFSRLNDLKLSSGNDMVFDGWAFRGLTSLECQWCP